MSSRSSQPCACIPIHLWFRDRDECVGTKLGSLSLITQCKPTSFSSLSLIRSAVELICACYLRDLQLYIPIHAHFRKGLVCQEYHQEPDWRLSEAISAVADLVEGRFIQLENENSIITTVLQHLMWQQQAETDSWAEANLQSKDSYMWITLYLISGWWWSRVQREYCWYSSVSDGECYQSWFMNGWSINHWNLPLPWKHGMYCHLWYLPLFMLFLEVLQPGTVTWILVFISSFQPSLPTWYRYS